MKLIPTLLIVIASIFSVGSAYAEAVDINSASASALAKALKGVGEKQAAAIVEYRKTNGPFKSADDLVNVPGIGKKTVANNIANIKVDKARSGTKAAQKTTGTSSSKTAQTKASGPVDVNSASASELAAALKGVGEKQAAAIIAYRQANGPFSSLDDLANVKGIGQKTLANNKANISFGKAAKAHSSSTSRSDSQAATTTRRSSSSAQRQAAATGVVNINTAGPEELQTLINVGPVKAERIIDYRRENGPFRSIEEIMNVSGIAEVTLEENRDRLVAD